MANRYWLSIAKRFLATLVAAFVVGYALQRWWFDTYGREDYVQAGLLAVGLYLFASIALGIVNALGSLLYIWLLRGKDIEELILFDLRRAAIPAPEDYDPRRFDYLVDLANNTAANPNDRVKAAHLVGAYNGAQNHMSFLWKIVHTEAVDAAILRYSREAPKRKSSQDTDFD